MNKLDLTKALSREIDLPIRKAEEVVNMVFDTMSSALISGDWIEIRGFGSFTIRQYDGYTGRNPWTGKEKAVGPKKLPFFKAGQDLREELKRRYVGEKPSGHGFGPSIHKTSLLTETFG